jgi:hypothetical protein
MLFDHVRQPHFLRDEVFDVEEHIVLELIHISEGNGTLERTLDSRKSIGVDGVVIVAASSSSSSSSSF